MQFVAILGLIHADNWDDPSNAKIRESADDLVDRGDEKTKQPMIIDRRFVDAVVEAVKEYTASSQLFHKVYGLMRTEALKGFTRKSPSSTGV